MTGLPGWIVQSLLGVAQEIPLWRGSRSSRQFIFSVPLCLCGQPYLEPSTSDYASRASSRVRMPGRLPEFAPALHVPVKARAVAHTGGRAPGVEVAAVDAAIGARLHDETGLGIVRDDADGIGPGRGDQLHRHGADAAGGAPDQHV